ncbi:hypothetical protein FACS1894211_16050 [Clostridia bacterium]|nr:hypothetical protein FACS1894211_16050 [Clostridia bacterium]
MNAGKSVQYLAEGYASLSKMIGATGCPGRYQYVYNVQTDKAELLKWLKKLKVVE